MRKDLLLFSDVVSADSHTVLSLMEMFYRPFYRSDESFALQEQKKVSLVNVLNAAGVETAWLSAQAPFGPWAAPISTLAKDSTVSEFFDKSAGGTYSKARFLADPDIRAKEALLQQLEASPQRAKRLLVQHMSASHGPYCKHVLHDDHYGLPAGGAAYFGEAADLSDSMLCYDKAIRFTDSIVADVIDVSSKRARPTIVIFVPDHGEAPEEGTGHNNSAHSARHVEIPMLVYFNTAARAAEPDAYAKVSALAGKPFVNRWVNELVMGLLDVSAKGLRQEIDAPLNESFVPPAREIMRSSGGIQYDRLSFSDGKDALELTRLNLKKVSEDGSWTKPLFAHRVDSMAKALEAKQYFSGIEMDLVFDEQSRRFDVRHPPAEKTGLSLDEQLIAIADKPNLQLWLDFKNPPAGRNTGALQLLNGLDQRWRLKSRTILELPAAAARDGMRAYSDAGWRTSYYLPPEFASCGGAAATAKCVKWAQQIIHDAQAGGATYLSFDYQLFPAVSRYIVPQKGALKLLSWTWIDADTQGLSEKLAALPRFDGLIIPFRSKFPY
jgi:hypothetical protein